MKVILVLLLAFAGVAAAQPADLGAAKKACADALNADPEFAKSVMTTFDKTLDKRMIEQHEAAAKKIQQNERHVIFAYGAMWVIAALFVGFLWLRQQRLKAEITALRHELDEAVKK